MAIQKNLLYCNPDKHMRRAEYGFTLISKAYKGFTLIEILIALVITGMMGAALLGLQFIISQNQIVAWQSYISVDEANANVTSLVREVRTAKESENGAYPLANADDHEIIFYSDYDFDGETERIRYYLNGTQFSKGVIEPVGQPATYPSGNEIVKLLSDNVRNGSVAVFYYYNGDWPADTVNNPLPTPSNLSEIKLVRILIKLNTDPDDPNNDYILESYSQVRVLKENL